MAEFLDEHIDTGGLMIGEITQMLIDIGRDADSRDGVLARHQLGSTPI